MTEDHTSLNRTQRIRKYTASLFDLDYTAIRSINLALERDVGLSQGIVLDYACGESPLRGLFEAAKWIRADVASNPADKDVILDPESGTTDLEVNSVDVVICTYGLEHIPNPRNAICEFSRVLKKNGILFITVPFINRLHEDPVDYHRFTTYYWDRVLGHDFVIRKQKIGNRWLVLVALWLESKIDEMRNTRPSLFSRWIRRAFRLVALPILNLTLFRIDADKTPSVYYHEIIIGTKK